ncbi:MAG: hypothetical protein CM1200mP30_19590 [Pseudomonadota bacterium]|nr:MAG: hypothetical protein CM1200mP30_19590 [Pseudomonadota bacterium]
MRFGARKYSGTPHSSSEPLTFGYANFHTYYTGKLDEVAVWDKGLSAAEITTLYNSGGGLDASSNSGNYNSASNLVGYWKMDENSGTSLADSSSNSNTATMINMSDADWIQGNASFSKSSASSSDNKTFTLDPSAFLSASTTYKTRVNNWSQGRCREQYQQSV